MNFYSLCVLAIVGIIGFNGFAQATSSCATVDANLNASLPCVAVKDSFYQVTLNYKVNPSDSSQPLWSLGAYTVTTDNVSCSTVSSFYNLSIPCVSVGGSDYKVELGRNDNQDNPAYFEWFLGTVEFIGATGTPKFDGVIFSTANNIDQVTIAWLDATDDKTPASEIKYNIYVSDIPNFTPSSSSFSHSVTGVKQTIISGLAAGKTYYVRVVAVDSDGLMSSEEKYATVTTLLNPVVLSDTVPLFVAEKNGLAIPTVVGSDYRFPYTGTETLPAEDSIIVGTDASGGYLRKVVKSSISGDQIIVQTTDGSLTDAVLQGSIKNSITLFDNPTSLGSSVNPLAKILKSSAPDSNLSSKNNLNKAEWQNNLLKFEEIVNPNKPVDLLIEKNGLSGRYLISTTAPDSQDKQAKTISTGSLSETLSYDLDVIFIPLLETDIDWKIGLSGIQILKGDIKATGVLNLDVTANYNFSAGGTFTKDLAFDVFKKKWTSVYLVGGFPVYQEITYTLSAHLQANALSAIKARAEANSFQSISFGVHYNPATKEWEPIVPTDSHYESLTANLSVMGEVDSAIRLIPNIEVKFYKVLAANLSVEPVILGKIQYEVVADADFLKGYFPPGTAQFTAFDASLNEQCFVGANLQIISKEFPLLNKTQVCNLPVYNIFSLPTLQLDSSSTGDGAYSLTATVKDGANDPFSEGSIKWILYPETAGKLLPKGRLATFTPSATPTTDKATIFFSGYGKLGEFGRQFVHTEISLASRTDDIEVNSAECVADDFNPGLFWEVKTIGGLRGIDNVYFWYNPDSSQNAGVAGTHYTINPDTKADINYNTDCKASSFSYCDTYGYVQAINSQGLCGAHDWRLPTEDEAILLRRNKVRAYQPVNIPVWIPLKNIWTGSNGYWGPEFASVLYSLDQIEDYFKRDYWAYVWLVRGNGSLTPNGSFPKN